ncbi:unnamed protein product [Ostreobium quekettii]|uniref:Aspartyl/asparaginy/proline hydroxylase domain-containing protein n=1 Tax=Ostreobium quekettii TaxID=121088 RepID=A0A8S1IST5_9CHLO|nr:unnamed protein product [Ostreobium quekettii]
MKDCYTWMPLQVRSSDRVYICDTGSGAVLELSFPGMQQLRRLPLFTRKEHVNTLAPVTEGSMWAVLHNLGQSQLAKIDLSSGMEVGRWNNVGVQSHGLVEWRYWFIMLDSGNGALLLVNPDNGRQMQIWKLPDDGRYLKGLTVADDVAYFGIAPLVDRQSRDDSQMSCELGAFDLIRNTLLWRRQLPTHGLLNVVGAPQWGESSTYKAVTSWARATPGAIRDMSQLQNDFVGGRWGSGVPFLNLEAKGHGSSRAGPQLILKQVNVSFLLEQILSLSSDKWSLAEQRRSNAVFTNRQSVSERFKPGMLSLTLIFSDNAGESVYWFPYFDLLRRALEPLVEEILGPNGMDHVIRLQLARMKPGTEVKKHVDSGGYAQLAHRIHVPLTSNGGVLFEVCTPEARSTSFFHTDEETCHGIDVAAGKAFEVNNRLPHRVVNSGQTDRIHLIMDAVEGIRRHTLFRPGQVCQYKETVEC